VQVWAIRRLYSQTLAAFGATCSNDGAAATRFHAGQEAVRTCAFDFGGLVCAFHDLSSFYYYCGYYDYLTDVCYFHRPIEDSLRLTNIV
jgi:hypothetical protein